MSATRNRHRLISIAAATLIAAAATPVTLAHANASASVSPSSVAPGGRVSLNITGCGTKTGTASSRAFGSVRLTPGNLEASNLFGSATVFRDISPGSHPVTFECGGPGGERVTVSLNVISGAARGGMGGSVGSMSPGQIALGGGLVAAALGAGVWVMRRRAEPSA
ncbi:MULTISPECIES: hypothetical protein [unclassified Streptomyces]|uniref:hypothetical protein n=1 Tax=unclassified Streptomyces TaxID=2593676 RepID=UPI001BEC2212|nr:MULTISPECIES: hypothetical protein [unclassified Streptomyces]MBT2406480.1 hypothetical protein [Streptomyces sp. ISL-21]MBT2458783.1 hypothetical protein [Streptomyces sp. ISL-86]MBT2613748.1 hypothetical protein [Streptomyces sp. ISL-87]